MEYAEKCLLDDFPFDDIIDLQDNAANHYHADQYINCSVDDNLTINTNVSSVASSSATYVSSSGCNSNSDSNSLMTDRRGSLPSSQPSGGRGEPCCCSVSDEVCLSCQMADVQNLAGSQPPTYSSNGNKSEMRITQVNLNNSENQLALMNSNYPANCMGDVSMNHNNPNLNLNKNMVGGSLFGHLMSNQMNPMNPMSNQMNPMNSIGNLMNPINNQTNSQMNSPMPGQMNCQIGGQMGYGHMNGQTSRLHSSPTHHHGAHLRLMGNQRICRIMAESQVPFGADQTVDEKGRKRSLDDDDASLKKMRSDHAQSIQTGYASVGDHCFGSLTAHETVHSQSFSLFNSQYGGQPAGQQQQSNLAVCQQQQSNYKLTDLSAIHSYDANNNIGQYAGNRTTSMLVSANGYVQNLNSSGQTKSSVFENLDPSQSSEVNSSQNSYGITQSDQNSPQNSNDTTLTPLDGTHNLSTDDAPDTSEAVPNSDEASGDQSDLPKKLVDAINKQMASTSSAKRNQAKQKSYFAYKDILALRLCDYKTPADKIARLFLYLNEKLGTNPNNQQFEFGSALSTAVALNPELADSTGCGTHHLRVMFTDTRNTFMNYLNLKKRKF